MALTIAAVAVSLYLALCAALFVVQRSLIYFPQPRSNVSGATTVTLPTPGAQLLVTTRAHRGANALVYFGGNAEDVSHSLPGLAAAFPDRAIYLMHYRGYGGSSGKPSEAALVGDAFALFDTIRAAHENIVVVGRSLGSGIAIQLAGKRPVARLVLITPFDSMQELAAAQFPYFPVRYLLRDKFESWKHAAQVVAPTLILAAENDDIIPRKSTETLFEHFQDGVAEFAVIPNTNHNTISESPEYVPLLKGDG